ncbi:hypothetical protein ACS0TY_032324 [Phlomoides rotata]
MCNLQSSVRPFRHNECERFTPASSPYYGASFSMVNITRQRSCNISQSFGKNSYLRSQSQVAG